MSAEMFHWRCPHCSEPLTIDDNNGDGVTWTCKNKHSYDRAKEGYINLLLAHHKNSKAPGDNRDMVLARRVFLSKGHYRPLADKVASIIAQYAQTHSCEPLRLFDAGCGEGYYLQSIVKHLENVDTIKTIQSAGIDISKPAIQKAAKANPSFYFAVASCFNLPVGDNSADAILQIFAPSDENEIARVLASKGIWVRVSPALNHLRELKALVYEKPQEHKVKQVKNDRFVLQYQTRLSFDIQLISKEERNALLLMTPFYWTISESKKTVLQEQLTDVSVDFDISIYNLK